MNSRGLQAEVKIVATSKPSKSTEPNTHPYTTIIPHDAHPQTWLLLCSSHGIQAQAEVNAKTRSQNHPHWNTSLSSIKQDQVQDEIQHAAAVVLWCYTNSS
jgi:hypothetical protein